MGTINNALSSYLDTLLTSALQNPQATSNTATGKTSVASTAAPIGQQSDSGQLSTFAQLLSTLQQLQQSNPTEYAKVTQQIATNLQSAAQTAKADGNSASASQLSTLATDFTNASTSGQLPDFSDLAQSSGGGGHHHHHGHYTQPDSDVSPIIDPMIDPKAPIATGTTATGTTATGTTATGTVSTSTSPTSAPSAQSPQAVSGNTANGWLNPADIYIQRPDLLASNS
jgi:hypothetical protein